MMDIKNRLHLYFTPIDIKKIHADSIINFDLYIETKKNFVLYKNRNLVIGADDLKRLTEFSVNSLYIHKKDKKNYKNYLEGNLETILNAEDVTVEKKAEALYESAINVVEDVFDNPRSGKSIKRSKQIIGHTVDFILQAPTAFSNLLKIRKYDYYTYTHSVNVCTFLVSLSQELGITDKKVLKEVGEGGLLHDLGKSQVPSKIINKSGKLSKSEWEIIQTHPTLGVQIAEDTRDISPISLSIIGQHHEKVTGNGYPNGLVGSELNQYANMASIVDIYDAITTSRSYSPARPPMEAAQILMQNKEDFNEKILLIFIKMLAVKGGTTK
ncbi:MAG: HD domain-containing protein [bacterium]|nr:HD domain-containing protein [bacterium]